eukprot:TRINITY_DN99442_c0_g1_i1.p2 TRINITY_DN99442_c0_g1~~TRINITY_DN99442_c0_g1_i1.p2  ORF type:complete len:168 (-),score=52.24 TRINITY_DN99442_c0_g1_i1:29-532(-)
MDNDAVYLPDDEALVPAEDLSALLAEGTSASVQELCSQGPSAAVLFGFILLAAAALLVCILTTWTAYADDIADFYREAAAAPGGDNWPLFAAPRATAGLGGSSDPSQPKDQQQHSQRPEAAAAAELRQRVANAQSAAAATACGAAVRSQEMPSASSPAMMSAAAPSS